MELTGVTKTYGSVEALTDLSLSVGDAEFFVLLGPSGAGKTTTLKSVAGLQEIDAGRVVIGGTDMTGVEPYHRNVAMAFESYALYPQKTVFENLASPLKSGRTGKYTDADQKQRIDLVTATLGIDQLQQRFPRELSNGQRQRVALGRVLVRPADIYLLDEPLSHLDAKLRAAMRAELKNLGEMSNTTCLYVTHDYQEALALGDRIGVLRQGRLVQVGTPEDIWLRPVDSFVAKALGQPEINMLGAEVQDGRLVAAAGLIAIPVPPELKVSRGDRVRLGLRPRDVGLGPTGGGDDGWLVLPGTIGLAERLGRLVEQSVRVGDVDLTIVTSSERAGREGESVQVHIPIEFVHVFAGGEPEQETARIGAASSERKIRSTTATSTTVEER